MDGGRGRKGVRPDAVEGTATDANDPGGSRGRRAARFHAGGSAPGGGGGAGGDGGADARRVAIHTAIVHVGTRSTPGTSSATAAGRNAQCQPSRHTRNALTTTSSPASSGENPPGANIGSRIHCTTSAAIATIQGARMERGRGADTGRTDSGDSLKAWPSKGGIARGVDSARHEPTRSSTDVEAFARSPRGGHEPRASGVRSGRLAVLRGVVAGVEFLDGVDLEHHLGHDGAQRVDDERVEVPPLARLEHREHP